MHRGSRRSGSSALRCDREIPIADGAVEGLWQASTTLREHRGDGHVALLTAEGLDGCEVLVLFAATAGVPNELLQTSRGWSAEDWAEARQRLVHRGLLNSDGTSTERGATLRAGIEARTDELAARPYEILGRGEVDRLILMTKHAANAIATAALIPHPNPMGLPAPQ